MNLQKRWLVAERIPPEAERNLKEYPPIMRQLLYNRGIHTLEDAIAFIDALPPEATDPFQMTDMTLAVERIRAAIQEDEKIAVYGDYDVDGVTATALLVEVLNQLGGNARAYIPDRFEEGYGLNDNALERLHQGGVQLVLAVDCGIRAHPQAEKARSLGMDLVIIDHHHPGAELPRACAVINPKRAGDPYPEKDLAGVGLAYKVVSALLSDKEEGRPTPEDFLDLVALGTVADMVPLRGENRALVRQGLWRMRQPRRQGLLALMHIAGVKPTRISSTDIAFFLGPRLNAAGRLDSALTAYDLLVARDSNKAGLLAQKLDNHNRERQRITADLQKQVEESALEEDPDIPLLFAAHAEFNQGVVGLAASRLAEKYYRPAVVAQIGESFTRGSCRSIPGFNITEALDSCADLLDHYGGHAAAAGFTINNRQLKEFEHRLKSLAQRELGDQELRPTLTADAEIPLRELKSDLLDQMEWLQPTGMDNPDPLFITRNLNVVRRRAVGRDKSHLKMLVSDGVEQIDAIAFRQGYWIEAMPSQVDLIYAFEVNVFNGRATRQLNVKDLKPSGEAG
jgi:single-stranded-DNA-specific exonuclease